MAGIRSVDTGTGGRTNDAMRACDSTRLWLGVRLGIKTKNPGSRGYDW
jgi:hypothetical protein